MARKNKSQTKSQTKVPTMLGIKIVNECPCRAEVNPWERQELVMHPDKKLWYRVCKKCLTKDRAFDPPKSATKLPNPGLHVA